MSQLTNEQRKRIEENRLKALQRRAAALGSCTTFSNQDESFPEKQTPYMSQRLKPPTNQTGSFLRKQIPSISQKFKTYYSQKHLAPTPLNKTFLRNSSYPVKHKTANLHSSNEMSNKFYGNNKKHFHYRSKNRNNNNFIKGKCVLHSRKRFYVDVLYHEELIDVFKTIPSNLYDPESNKWSFLLKDYETLILAAKSVNAFLQPLPFHILKTFSSAPEDRVIKDHDLSSIDPVLLHSLFPFQIEGVNFGIQKGGRVLIADDMGLGKTIQAIAIVDYFKNWPLLVVAPSSVKYSWKESFHRWLPSVDPQEVAVVNSGKDPFPETQIVLISYNLLTTRKSEVLDRRFKSVILDESHLLKNIKTLRSKAASAIAAKATRIVMLSGTPALSRPIELYTQVHTLRQREFFSYMEFGMRYCNGQKTRYGFDFSGSSRMGELQLLLEETVMIRRLKSDVLKQLPPKLRQLVVLDPSLVSTGSKTFQKLRQKYYRSKDRKLLMEYYICTAVAKLKAVCEYVLYLLESDRKFILFAHHQIVLKGVLAFVEDKKTDFIFIDGSVSSQHRKQLCDKFQNEDSCKVALLSITAANCGITLSAASLVVIAELFWNPGVLVQAEDRAHRIGQENSVLVQYLVARGTADDELWPLVLKKLDVLNRAGLSQDDLKSADTIMCQDGRLTVEDFQVLSGDIEDCDDLNVVDNNDDMNVVDNNDNMNVDDMNVVDNNDNMNVDNMNVVDNNDNMNVVDNNNMNDDINVVEIDDDNDVVEIDDDNDVVEIDDDNDVVEIDDDNDVKIDNDIDVVEIDIDVIEIE